MISKSSYLTKARWCAHILHVHNLWHMPQSQNPISWPTTTSSRDSSPLWAAVLVVCDGAYRPLAAATLWEAEAAGNTFVVDVDQHLLCESADGNHNSDVPLPDVPLPEAASDGLVGKKSSSPHIADEVMVDVFGLESGSCLVSFIYLNPSISETNSDMRRGDMFAWCVFVLQLVLARSCRLVHFLWWNLVISGIDYYTRCKVFGLLRVYFSVYS